MLPLPNRVIHCPLLSIHTLLPTFFICQPTLWISFNSAIKKNKKNKTKRESNRKRTNIHTPGSVYHATIKTIAKNQSRTILSTPLFFVRSETKQQVSADRYNTWKTTKLAVVCVCVYVCVCVCVVSPHLHSARARLRSQRHSLWPMTVPRLRNPAQTKHTRYSGPPSCVHV